MSSAADDDPSGIAGNLTAHNPRPIVVVLATLRVLFKTLNIAADIAAMGEPLQMLVGGPEHGRALMFGVLLASKPEVPGPGRLLKVLGGSATALMAAAVAAMIWSMLS